MYTAGAGISNEKKVFDKWLRQGKEALSTR